MEIIDFRVRPSTAYFFKDLIPEVIPAYQRYVEMFHIEPRLELTSLKEFVSRLGRSPVTQAVIFSPDAAGNDEVHRTCSKFPDQFHGLAGVDSRAGPDQSVDELKRAYSKLGLLGLSLSPFMTGIRPNDKRYYPLYELSEKRGKVVQIHSALHYNPAVPLNVSHPQHLEPIAVDFPKLRIVMCHAGFGFGTLGLTMVKKHKNMFADFSGLHPRGRHHDYLAAIADQLQDKAIFGTNYPCLDFSIVKSWKRKLPPKVQKKFFQDNARRALGLAG